MKKRNALFITAMILVTLAACSGGLPELPTPNVPNPADINNARILWENSNTTSYFADIEFEDDAGSIRYRIVVREGEVIIAQKLTAAGSTDWSEPQAAEFEDAAQFTVAEVYNRLIRDSLGHGEVFYNVDVYFDPSMHYPTIINAEGLSSYNDQNQLVLNHQHSYTLTMSVSLPLEDVFGVGKEPLLELFRTGGPDAWCDTLRIFEDGSSIYTNNCMQALLQLTAPASRMQELETLLGAFEKLDAIQEAVLGHQHLVIQGNGSGEASEAVQSDAWDISQTLMDLLSKPLGEGLTLLYTQGDNLFGLDMRTFIIQPAQQTFEEPLYDMLVSPDYQNLAYGDASGIRRFDLKTGDTPSLLTAPDSAHYEPHVWTNSGYIIVELIPNNSASARELGWVSLEEKYWHPIPLPKELEDFSCDISITSDPAGTLLAIAGAGPETDCGTNPGLTIVDLEDGTAITLLADTTILSGVEDQRVPAGIYNPAWSDNGKWIAISMAGDAEEAGTIPSHIYTVRADGSELTRISDNQSGQADHPVWRSDSHALSYALNGLDEDTDGLYEYNFTTQETTQLVSGSGFVSHAISPGGDFLVYTNNHNLYAYGFGLDENIPITVSGTENYPTVYVGFLDETPEE